ncbi:MAG: hypothetical protein Ta2G_12200 [Termitinemataceae bacterium]|nr:MAG: hypothetical protein Ta2G_12200 [Termitinemataceae bacterium]
MNEKNLYEEKNKLTSHLADQYSKSIISIAEYEQGLDNINKIETIKDLPQIINNEKTHLSLFSWRTSNIKTNSTGKRKYISLFGANQIIIDDLPKGKTELNVASIFGLTEIYVPKNIKVINEATALLGGVFAHGELNDSAILSEVELHISGKAVFGNITIIRQ